MSNLNPDKPRAISLFSGAGGMDVGFADAGFEIVFANDLDAAACETYKKNHSNVIAHGDLRQQLPLSARFADIDLVFGGPPCQGFSVAGKMNPDDERSTLIDTFMDVVEDVSPKAFVCENVKALASLKRWKEVREKLLARARLNYHTALIILNSSEFGVPQARERMFLVGLSKRQFWGMNENLHDALLACLANLKETPKTIAQIIRELGRAGSSTNSRTCTAKISYAKNPVLRPSAYAGMLFNGAGRPLKANGVSPTLAASMGGNKTPIVDEAEIFDGADSFVEAYHAHLLGGGEPNVGAVPSRLRRLTVDECLAIQSFPDGYELAGGQSAMYRQIGNAVPCKLAHAIARVIEHFLRTKEISSASFSSDKPLNTSQVAAE